MRGVGLAPVVGAGGKVVRQEGGSMSAAVEADDIELYVGSGVTPIVEHLTLAIADGERLAILGPSGGGKTTFLNMIAGLQQYTGGTLRVRGEQPRAGRPDMAYAMARDALLPWRTAVENVELPLVIQGVRASERRERALSALDQVGLINAAGEYRARLSQGMRQRVALARTFVTQPSLLLLDEPFAALDAQTRVLMSELLLRLVEASRGTAILVTHDLGEAIAFGDRIVLLSSRPACVRAIYDVSIPRPRDVHRLRLEPSFVELYGQIWDALRAELTL